MLLGRIGHRAIPHAQRAGAKYYGAFSFVFIYCAYNAYFRHFEDGPVAAALGDMAGMFKLVESFGVIVGVVVALCLPWSRLVEQKRPLKLLLHLCAFFPFWLLPLFSDTVPIIVLGVLGGICVGAVMARSLYTMFFEVMDLHPARVTVVGYAIIQTFIHLSDIVPLVAIPMLYYTLSIITLMAGLVFSYLRRDEEEIGRRRTLPENRFQLVDIWQILALIALIQLCLSFYGTALFSQTLWPGRFAEALNIIPDVLMLTFLWFCGKRLTLSGSLITFLLLFVCVIASFLIYGENARIPMQFFMEPAYRVADFLFVWTLMVVFYTYGRHQLRLKACLTLFFAVRFGSLIILEALLAQGLPIAEGGFVILLPAFLATLLIPAAQRAIRSMEARRVYAEEQQGPNIPLPSERSDVLSACDDLIQALPEGVVLDDDERTALCYLIDGQDADVTAYFMKTSTRRVRELNANVFAKFGVKSSHELIMELGAMRTRAGRENREALFERYNLTAREREIVTLLLSGEAMKNIAGTLGISQSTVNFHSTNLYRKLNVQSRVQLMERFLSEENTR